MRKNLKPTIVQSALRLAGRDGIDRLTLDAVAAEAGVSKGGLLYHFASKEDLLIGMMQHLVATMEEEMLRALPVPFDESTPEQRFDAYRQASLSGEVGDLDLSITLGALSDTSLSHYWDELIERWIPAPRNVNDRMDLFLASMAIDGLWLYFATSTVTLPPDVREELSARIAAMVRTDNAPAN